VIARDDMGIVVAEPCRRTPEGASSPLSVGQGAVTQHREHTGATPDEGRSSDEEPPRPRVGDRQEVARERNKKGEGTSPACPAALAPGFGRLLTVQQAADMFGVSTRTIRRLIRRGDLAAHRITRSIVRVDGESVMRLLEATRMAASPGSSCPREDEDTSSARPISSGSAAAQESGRRSSTGARSRSVPRMGPRPSNDSLPAPSRAAKLREKTLARRRSR
jgi:excisionase family DNA binding protein